MLCLGAAIVAHSLLFVGWSFEQRENRQAQKDPIGVEFVYLDPAVNDSEETGTSRRAQTDSAAGGTRNPERPVSAGKTSAAAPAQPVPDRPIPSRPPQSVSQPAAAEPPPAASPPSPSPSISRPTATQRTTVRSPAIVQPAQPTVPQSAIAPRPTVPTAPPAPPLNPQSGQGLDGQINPDRTASGTASIEAAADELWGVYVSSLNRKIDQNWERITVLTTLQARVQFEIDRQGRLIDLRLVEPSGDSTADTVALQAVRLAAPFSPFPAQTTESQLRVNFTFTYYPANASPASQSLDSPQPLTPAQ